MRRENKGTNPERKSSGKKRTRTGKGGRMISSSCISPDFTFFGRHLQSICSTKHCKTAVHRRIRTPCWIFSLFLNGEGKGWRQSVRKLRQWAFCMRILWLLLLEKSLAILMLSLWIVLIRLDLDPICVGSFCFLVWAFQEEVNPWRILVLFRFAWWFHWKTCVFWDL